MTSKQLLDALTVEDYLHTVGSTHPDPEFTRRLAATGKTLGERGASVCVCVCGGWLCAYLAFALPQELCRAAVERGQGSNSVLFANV